MASVPFEINVISAKDLENVRRFFKMEVHARVSVGTIPEKRTPTDRHGGTNPAWNHTMNYTISETMMQNPNNNLVIKLYCTKILADKYIGEVSISMKELFHIARSGGGSAALSLPLMKGSANSQGGLNFSYKFGDRVINNY